MGSHYAGAVLFTINLQSISDFYVKTVGMAVLNTEIDHVVLEINGFQLVIHQIPDEYASSISIPTPPNVRELSAIKLSLPVSSISNARQFAAELGGCVYEPEREFDYDGILCCDGWDPDGNVFQVFQPKVNP